MSLGNSFKEAYSRNRTDSLLNWIFQSIELGLWPWKPGKITAWTEQDFAQFGPKLTFEVEHFPNLPFVAYPDVIRYDFDVMAYKVANEAFKFYRNRPALPVDDHIVLGEE